MRTRGPTFGQIAVAVAFAFSCFGLLLFLWTTFGGPIPLKPEGYRIEVPFDEATQLADSVLPLATAASLRDHADIRARYLGAVTDRLPLPSTGAAGAAPPAGPGRTPPDPSGAGACR